MIAQLEISFPDMNQLVADSAAAARNAPWPSPVAPGARRFWRIVADWSVDTDQDGSPDWAEFEMMADANHPSHAMADPFDPDADDNQIADGDEIDLDGDGSFDAVDIATAEPVVNLVTQSEPRYAVFPITGTQPPPGETKPLQINDQGTVLYVNGTWSGGIWTALNATGTSLTQCRAHGINDGGEILGAGLLEIEPEPDFRTASILTRWSSPSATPAPIAVGDDYAVASEALAARTLSPGPVISNDGHVLGYSGVLDSSDVNPFLDVDRDLFYRWTIQGPGRTPAKNPVPVGMTRIVNENTYWGWVVGEDSQDSECKIFGPPNPGALDWTPLNILPISLGLPIAFGPNTAATAYHSGSWRPAGPYSIATDVSEDGTAIARKESGMLAPILINAKWRDMTRTAAFDVPQEWRNSSVTHLDTTPGGWILTQSGPEEDPDYAAMLPLKVEGEFTNSNDQIVRQATGVDDFSIGADSMSLAVKDRLWVMAPQGNTLDLKIKAPLSSTTSVELSATGVTFNGSAAATLSDDETSLVVQATSGAVSGSEALAELKLDGVAASASKPLGFKVMKDRTLRVAVYQVAKAATNGTPQITPNLVPDEDDLRDYLNDICKQQLNVSVEVKIEPTVLVVNWDIGQVNLSLDGNGINGTLTSEQASIETAKNVVLADQANQPGHVPFNEHVAVYLVGTRKPISLDAFGITSRETKTCWVIGNLVSPMGSDTLLQYDPAGGHLHTIAHEIGHVLLGPGHPDQNASPGPAKLTGTQNWRRLMCGATNVLQPGKLLVKGEWDAAEVWLNQVIDTPSNP